LERRPARNIGTNGALAVGAYVALAGPFLGTLVGVCLEWILKGKATAAGAIAAQEILDEANGE
jgi:hypothetical protein